jgi:hypothetical protein
MIKAVFSAGSAPRLYNEDPRPPEKNGESCGLGVQLRSAREAEKTWRYSWVDSWQEFSTGGFDKRTWAREAEESPVLETVVRERLVKTQHAGESLAGAVVNCKVWRTAMVL